VTDLSFFAWEVPMTQLLKARNGVITPEMETILESEPISRDALLKGVGDGTIVVLANPAHVKMGGVPLAIGKGTRIKVNANLGTSQDDYRMAQEKAKLEASLKAKADTVMDLSTGGDLNAIRRTLINDCPFPLERSPSTRRKRISQPGKDHFWTLLPKIFSQSSKIRPGTEWTS